MHKVPVILKVTLAWLPFFLLWSLFVLTFSGGDASPGEALAAGVISIGSAAVLGGFVWIFTGRLPWPERIRPRFYLLHLLVGLTYAVAWIALAGTLSVVWYGIDPDVFVEDSLRILGWELLMGLLIYGGVAAVSYALRIRERLRQQERIAAQAQALAAQAQLRALRAKLNPHFLFNALHSVSFLVQEDPDEAEAAIDQLGDLLRYALDEGGDDEVLLMDEWAFTSAYLDLESIRFGSRLRVEADLEPDALSCPVPPFSLQPLVENAVRHGIDPRPEGGLIAVHALAADGRLTVTVRDDGPGAEPATTTDGHGLGDLRKRLAALYGPAAQLVIDTTPGRGFEVRLTVPVEPEEVLDPKTDGPGASDDLRPDEVHEAEDAPVP